MNAQLTGFIDEEFMRNLDKQSSAVARIWLGTYGTPVLHTPKHLESIRHNFVRLAAFDMGHKADTAIVVFKLRAVESRQLVNLIRHGRNSVG
ncbi:hypothetical protein GCM10028819_33780 [Spirosoma humi]